MWTATATLIVSRAEDLTRIRNLRNQLGIWHSEDLTKKGSHTTWLPCRREQDHIQTPAGCDKLRAIVETESMTWAERILRPEADMVIHHTVIERAHVGWLEADSWRNPGLEPRGAIIARREGYGTMMLTCLPRHRCRITCQDPSHPVANLHHWSKEWITIRLNLCLWQSMGETYMSGTAGEHTRLAQVRGAQ